MDVVVVVGVVDTSWSEGFGATVGFVGVNSVGFAGVGAVVFAGVGAVVGAAVGNGVGDGVGDTAASSEASSVFHLTPELPDLASG